MKISVEEFQRLAPFHLTPIPWIPNGFYYEREDDPARHPFYYAGLYYLQEPSAMTPASILPVMPGEHVLDLCAAPGGKATALGAKLAGEGLLVANDISASRAKALLKNLEIFGIRNSFVTNAYPAKLAEQFAGAFDKILVDAPCSGEGMFRKDLANARVWSLEKVKECAKTQHEIIRQAVSMLRPGGLLLYSTCTFSPEENEQTIASLLQEDTRMRLVEIPWQEGFSHGRPDLADGNVELEKCIRIFPHRMGGEGHFLALLYKKKEGEEDTALRLSEMLQAQAGAGVVSGKNTAAQEVPNLRISTGNGKKQARLWISRVQTGSGVEKTTIRLSLMRTFWKNSYRISPRRPDIHLRIWTSAMARFTTSRTASRQAAASRFFATASILVSCARAASSHPSRLQWPYAHLTTLPSLISHRQTNACAAIWAERPSM